MLEEKLNFYEHKIDELEDIINQIKNDNKVLEDNY